MKLFFKRIWAFIKMLFVNPTEWISKHVVPSVELVQSIKKLVDSPIAATLTTLIPGQIDDVIRQRISDSLGIVIGSFTQGLNIIDSDAPIDVKIEKFIEWIKTLPPALRAAIYGKLAARLAKESAGTNDGLVKNHAVDLLTQVYYSKIKAGVNESELPITTERNTIDVARVYE